MNGMLAAMEPVSNNPEPRAILPLEIAANNELRERLHDAQITLSKTGELTVHLRGQEDALDISIRPEGKVFFGVIIEARPKTFRGNAYNLSNVGLVVHRITAEDADEDIRVTCPASYQIRCGPLHPDASYILQIVGPPPVRRGAPTPDTQPSREKVPPSDLEDTSIFDLSEDRSSELVGAGAHDIGDHQKSPDQSSVR